MDNVVRLCSGVLLGSFVFMTAFLSSEVNEAQPQPYMDEVFHVPQAQKYCDGNFTEWDPMITTLPGLYVVSAGLLKPLELFSSFNKTVCSTSWLRTVNLIFTAGNLFLFYQLDIILNGMKKTHVSPLMTAVTLSLFPLLYFFTFLYYTDSGSTFFVLLMYLLHERRQNWLAACAGAAAVLFRQTNIVWIMFLAGLSAIKIIKNFANNKNPSMDGIEVLKAAISRCRKCIKDNRSDLNYIVFDFFHQIMPYAFVLIGFVAFVYVNGSIVVGAKQDHPAGLHLPQVLYFAAFLGTFSFVHLISFQKLLSFWNLLLKHPFLFFSIAAVCAIVIGNFTIAHRYLLADNRHYTFYVWARVFQRHHLFRYMLIPGYMFTIWGALRVLEKGMLWKVVYCICIIINLVPATLIEFRYFILPYLVFRLNISNVTYLKLLVELSFYVLVNLITMYLFLKKPFYWTDDPNPQRFMW